MILNHYKLFIKKNYFNIISKNKINSPCTLGFLFLVTLAIGFFVQFFLIQMILPLIISNFNGELGLLPNRDWITFHNLALELVEKLNSGEFKMWKLRPDGFTTGLPGILSLLYFYIWEKPAVFLFLNAALYSISVYCIIIVFKIKNYLAIFPFFFFPSTLILYTQVHNDIFNLASFALLLYVYNQKVKFLSRILLVLMAYLFLFLTRNHLVPVFFLLFFTFSLIKFIEFKNIRNLIQELIISGLAASLALVLASSSAASFVKASPALDHGWTSSSILPHFIDAKLKSLSLSREGFNSTASFSNSNIDPQVRLLSAFDIVAYSPRALYISLMEPNPISQKQKNTNTISKIENFVSKIEMIISYLIFFIVLICIKKIKKYLLQYKASLVVIFLILTLYGIVFSNVGTLYRMRLPYYLILLTILINGILQKEQELAK